MVTKIALPVPQPVYSYVKLKVVKDLRIENAVYTSGHEIEVFHHEAVALLRDYPDHFEVIQ